VRHQLIDCLPAGTTTHPGAINEMLQRCNFTIAVPRVVPVIIRCLDVLGKSGVGRFRNALCGDETLW